MTRPGLFGWSYPPGCSGPPTYEGEDPSELQEEVGILLEDAGMPEHYCDLVAEIIIAWETRKLEAERGEGGEQMGHNTCNTCLSKSGCSRYEVTGVDCPYWKDGDGKATKGESHEQAEHDQDR